MKQQFLVAASLLLALSCQPASAKETIVVSAAASLKASFNEMAREFERDNPDFAVATNFSSSTQLAAQIEQGAKVDVYASADRRNMEQLTGKGLIAQSTDLAHSRLTAIVFKSSSVGANLEQLAKPGVKIVMPAPTLPAATYLAQFLKNADAAGMGGGQYGVGVRRNAVSQEPDIRMVVMKVAMGEGDAGFVYITDITPDVKDKLVQVPIPDKLNVRTDYVIGMVKAAKPSAGARRFYDFVLSARGKAIMSGYGFQTGP
ncbi:MAG: molybdate ABC transporter substrate-binding protein [Pseudomonadota bacterium]